MQIDLCDGMDELALADVYRKVCRVEDVSDWVETWDCLAERLHKTPGGQGLRDMVSEAVWDDIDHALYENPSLGFDEYISEREARALEDMWLPDGRAFDAEERRWLYGRFVSATDRAEEQKWIDSRARSLYAGDGAPSSLPDIRPHAIGRDRLRQSIAGSSVEGRDVVVLDDCVPLFRESVPERGGLESSAAHEADLPSFLACGDAECVLPLVACLVRPDVVNLVACVPEPQWESIASEARAGAGDLAHLGHHIISRNPDMRCVVAWDAEVVDGRLRRVGDRVVFERQWRGLSLSRSTPAAGVGASRLAGDPGHGIRPSGSGRGGNPPAAAPVPSRRR